ncbi:MAG: DMT family transporter [Thermoanaerobaculia bacterium]|nr:DMT family transporter [Thermoanaerobaculia bacterium]
MSLRGAWGAAPAQIRGVLLVALAAFGFSSMHTVIRFLASDLHPFEIAFFRNLFGLVALIPALIATGRRRLRTDHLRLHLLRSCLQLVSMLLFFYALSVTPLARVSAMSFTGPLFATVGAVVFLGEAIHARRIVALLVGFAGALIVMRPAPAAGGEGPELAASGLALDPGVVLVLLSSFGWSIALIVIKVLSRTDSSVTLAMWMGIFMAPLSLVPALFVWRWPEPGDYFWLALMGVVGVGGHLAMSQAFKETDATAVLPVDFTRLVWASLLGFLVFGERPELATWIGGAVIFASTTYIAWREARANRDAGDDGHRPLADEPQAS